MSPFTKEDSFKFRKKYGIDTFESYRANYVKNITSLVNYHFHKLEYMLLIFFYNMRTIYIYRLKLKK